MRRYLPWGRERGCAGGGTRRSLAYCRISSKICAWGQGSPSGGRRAVVVWRPRARACATSAGSAPLPSFLTASMKARVQTPPAAVSYATLSSAAAETPKMSPIDLSSTYLGPTGSVSSA